MSERSIYLPELKSARRVLSHMTRRFSISIFIAFSALLTHPTFAQTLNYTHTVTLNNIDIDVQMAQTQTEQTRGLQGQKHLNDHQGMLFIFKPARQVCMWMKDVPIDLDVGFFSSVGSLQSTSTMKAQTETLHCSKAPVSYALEVRGGWFADRKVTAGTPLTVKKRTSASMSKRP